MKRHAKLQFDKSAMQVLLKVLRLLQHALVDLIVGHRREAIAVYEVVY